MEYQLSSTSKVILINNFLEDDYLDRCIELDLEDDPKFSMMGKVCTMHRRVGFYVSNENISPYYFTNQVAKTSIMPEWMKDIMSKINETIGTDFNACLVNHYRNGEDSIGMHSDRDDNLSNGIVASVSFGEPRKFVFKDKFTNKTVFTTETENNQLLVMHGINFQKEFTHGIPVQKKVKNSRVSLTFRKHKLN